jgi:hypothetical protein
VCFARVLCACAEREGSGGKKRTSLEPRALECRSVGSTEIKMRLGAGSWELGVGSWIKRAQTGRAEAHARALDSLSRPIRHVVRRETEERRERLRPQSSQRVQTSRKESRESGPHDSPSLSLSLSLSLSRLVARSSPHPDCGAAFLPAELRAALNTFNGSWRIPPLFLSPSLPLSLGHRTHFTPPPAPPLSQPRETHSLALSSPTTSLLFYVIAVYARTRYSRSLTPTS